MFRGPPRSDGLHQRVAVAPRIPLVAVPGADALVDGL